MYCSGRSVLWYVSMYLLGITMPSQHKYWKGAASQGTGCDEITQGLPINLQERITCAVPLLDSRTHSSSILYVPCLYE